MKKEELAAILNGRPYSSEITEDEEKQAKAAGLVVVFGYSDDNVELRGAIDEEIGAYNGTTINLDKHGVFPAWDSIDHDDEEECAKYFARRDRPQWPIKAIWCVRKDGPAWTFETGIPCATFDIWENGEVFCRGLVFDLARL